MFEPVIKWSGSKRSQASSIVALAPRFKTYFEPFLGGGSVLYAINPKKAVCGDICKPLIELWLLIRDNPAQLISNYRENWRRLQEEGYRTYYEIRDEFNRDQNPACFFFLSRTCVNGLIRFNKDGHFNNSLHHTRKGINPDRAERIIRDWSRHIQKVEFVHADYRESTRNATARDFVYLDPPYFNTRGRYYGKIDFPEFTDYLNELKTRGVKYAISLDGKRGDLEYFVDLPPSLYRRHLFLPSGN